MEALNWVREGSIDELSAWLKETNIKPTVEEEDEVASQRRSVCFGNASFCLGMSLLLWTVDNSDLTIEKKLEMCSLLLCSYPTLIDHSGPDKATPLHYVAGNGEILLLSFLLEKGAKILLDEKNETPLHWASLNGHAKAVKLLLQYGANPNDRSTDGKTGLHYAVMNKHANVVTLLLSDQRMDVNAKKEARDIAVQRSDKDLVQLFDPEKREILVVVQGQQKELEEYKEKIRQYELQREADKITLTNTYKKLAELEEAHRNIKQEIDQLKEYSHTRVTTNYEQNYNKLRLEYLATERENLQLQQQLEQLHLKQSEERRKLDVRISDVHRTLSSLSAMLDTTNMAIMSGKNALEYIRPHLYTLVSPTDHSKGGV